MIETIFVVGPAGSGKSEFAQYLAAALGRESFVSVRDASGWPVGDTSAPLIRWLAQIQAAGDYATLGHACVDTWMNYILANKERFRPQLVRLAEIARSIQPYTLVALAEDAGARIVTGLRKRCEFIGGALVNAEHMPEFSARAKAEGRIVIYVDHGGTPVADGFDAEFYKALAHYHVSQRGVLSGEGLAYQAGLIAAQMLAEKIVSGGGGA